MSTKTTFKRIALASVVALAAGLLSSAPSNAATITAASASAVAQKAGTGDNGQGGIAGPANTVTVTVTIKNGASAASTYGEFITVTGADAKILSTTAGSLTVAASAGSAIYAATAGAATGAPNTQDIIISTPSVGSIVVNVYDSTTQAGTVYSSTPDATATITVAAAGISGTPSASSSTVAIKYAALAGTAFPTTDATAATVSNVTGSVGTAYIYALYKDGAATPAILASTVDSKISATGPCLVQEGIGATGFGKVVTVAAASSDGVADNAAGTPGTGGTGIRVDVKGDNSGIGGACVVTVEARKEGSTTYTTIATKTVTFYGTVASLAFSPVVNVIADTADAVLTADTDAYAAVITAKDAGGNSVPLTAGGFTAPTAAQLTAAEITNAATVAATAGTYSGTTLVGTDIVLVVDATATKTGAKSLTLTHTATGKTVTVTFNVGLVKASSVSMSLNKATYTPGEKMTLTISALGSDGKAIADHAADEAGSDAFLSATAVATSLSVLGAVLTGTKPAFVGGKAVYSIYAPLSAGPVAFTATTGAAGTYVETAAAAKALSATATITGGNLETLVNSLIKKINALATLVAKIQKKLGVK